MKPKLSIVAPQPAPEPIEPQLRKLLRQERSLELRLIKTRALIAPLKREYAVKSRTFGRSNEALLLALSHKDT